jgi:hypothetical protein
LRHSFSLRKIHKSGGGKAIKQRRNFCFFVKSWRVQPQGQALKKFFAWAQQKKLIPANPAAALRFLRRQERSQPESRPAEFQPRQ